MSLISEQLEYIDSENYKIKEYSDEVRFRELLEGLHSLTKNNKLQENEKLEIINFLDKISLNYVGSYYWRNYVEIIQELNPNSKFLNFQKKFRKNQLNEIEEYWNRKIYSSNNIDSYLEKMNHIGLYKKQLSNQQKNDFIIDNLHDSREVIVWDLLERLEIAYHYDAESGFYPPSYEDILIKYLELCSEELSNYQFKIEKNKNEQEQINIVLYLFNNSQIFKIQTDENSGDWFDVSAINGLFNKVLEVNGKKQRFINIFTDDQTVLPIYCEPGQAELFSQNFGLRLEYKLNFDQ